MDLLTNKKTTPCRIPLEDEVRTKTIKYMEKNHKCKVERVEPNKHTRRKGLPDLLVFCPNGVKMLEVKTYKGKLSPYQTNILDFVGNHNKCTVMYGFDTEYIDKFIKGELQYE